MLTPERLRGNLFDLLRNDYAMASAVRFDDRSEITYRRGQAELLVTVHFETLSYRVTGTPQVASFEDLSNVHSLACWVKAFLSALRTIGVKDAATGY